MNKITIYTSNTCPYCIKAKKLLKSLGLEFKENDVTNSFDEMCQELSETFDKTVSTIPQIIINDNYIGGYDNLEAAHKSGRLKEILL